MTDVSGGSPTMRNPQQVALEQVQATVARKLFDLRDVTDGR